MRSRGVSPIDDLIMDLDSRLAQDAGNGPSPLENGTENLHFLHNASNTHFHLACRWIRLDNRFDFSRQITDVAVKPSFTMSISLWSSRVGQTTGRQQPAAKGP